MLAEHSWPQAVLHVDGDGFFASVSQALHPELKGKPVVVGKERGMAIAVSYEAKKYGIKRCMLISQAKKLCPSCVAVDSDFAMYSLFSQKMFSIMRSYTPMVEEYSIDEGFADIAGLRRPLNMTYEQMGKKIKDHIESSLGISVSVGISVTKSLAKLASNFRKPSGLTIVPGKYVEKLLSLTPIGAVWGIGPSSAAYLHKLGVKTALDYSLKSEEYITRRMNKPLVEIWRELNGRQEYEVNIHAKTVYKSMGDTKTFTPTSDQKVLWAKLMHHVEESFFRARTFNYKVKVISIFLKTQSFAYYSYEIKLSTPTSYPHLVYDQIKEGFEKIYKKNIIYRTTGCYISHFDESGLSQGNLFEDIAKVEKIKHIYPLYEQRKVNFGFSLFDPDRTINKQKTSKFFLPTMAVSDV
jgi:DNA polymerase-4/DNA polymerase V